MLRGIIRGNIVSTRKQDALIGSKFMEAEIMKNLRIEVISEPGEEMKIKITGSYKQVLPPEFSMFFYDLTKTNSENTGL